MFKKFKSCNTVVACIICAIIACAAIFISIFAIKPIDTDNSVIVAIIALTIVILGISATICITAIFIQILKTNQKLTSLELDDKILKKVLHIHDDQSSKEIQSSENSQQYHISSEIEIEIEIEKLK